MIKVGARTVYRYLRAINARGPLRFKRALFDTRESERGSRFVQARGKRISRGESGGLSSVRVVDWTWAFCIGKTQLGGVVTGRNSCLWLIFGGLN